jgi:ubiquinone/menaquinone biosynthesis C-methylase UbiE
MDNIVDLYRKRARNYNITANLYYLIGFREYAYRKKAVDSLNLQKGDTVIEVGCGTGLNFSLLQQAIGPEGKIIGVDLTDAMLDQARKLSEKKGWSNVQLIMSDAAEYQFPQNVDGIISTFAITLVPEFDRVIQNGCKALKLDKNWVILDFKMPSNWLSHLAPLAILLTRPFGVNIDLAARHPWESIEKHMKNLNMIELYRGFVYIAVGKRQEKSC